MNSIEKQILLNQKVLMESQLNYSVDSELLLELDNTRELLNPKIKDEPCCEMEEENNGK